MFLISQWLQCCYHGTLKGSNESDFLNRNLKKKNLKIHFSDGIVLKPAALKQPQIPAATTPLILTELQHSVWKHSHSTIFCAVTAVCELWWCCVMMKALFSWGHLKNLQWHLCIKPWNRKAHIKTLQIHDDSLSKTQGTSNSSKGST